MQHGGCERRSSYRPQLGLPHVLYWLCDLLWPKGHYQIWSERRLDKMLVLQGVFFWNNVAMIWSSQSSLSEEERLCRERPADLSAAPANSPPECGPRGEPSQGKPQEKLPRQAQQSCPATTQAKERRYSAVTDECHELRGGLGITAWATVRRPQKMTEFYPTLLQRNGNQKERMRPSEVLLPFPGGVWPAPGPPAPGLRHPREAGAGKSSSTRSSWLRGRKWWGATGSRCRCPCPCPCAPCLVGNGSGSRNREHRDGHGRTDVTPIWAQSLNAASDQQPSVQGTGPRWGRGTFVTSFVPPAAPCPPPRCMPTWRDSRPDKHSGLSPFAASVSSERGNPASQPAPASVMSLPRSLWRQGQKSPKPATTPAQLGPCPGIPTPRQGSLCPPSDLSASASSTPGVRTHAPAGSGGCSALSASATPPPSMDAATLDGRRSAAVHVFPGASFKLRWDETLLWTCSLSPPHPRGTRLAPLTTAHLNPSTAHNRDAPVWGAPAGAAAYHGRQEPAPQHPHVHTAFQSRVAEWSQQSCQSSAGRRAGHVKAII